MMKHLHLPQKLTSICLLLMAGGAYAGAGRGTEEKSEFRPSEWKAVSDDNLDKMRGGFDVAPGLNVSFGIVRSVTINGELVSKTSFDLPDVSRITAEQASLVRATIAGSSVIQLGAGNFVDPGVRSDLAAGIVIQNSLNDQQIQTLTVIDAGVNSLGLLKSINTQTVLRDALMDSMRNL